MGAGEHAQDRLDQLAIEQLVVGLVAVAHEAVVARGLAVLAGASAAAEILAGLRIEVADRQRLAGDCRQRRRILDEPAQHAGAAFGRLVDQDQSAIISRRQRLDSQLAVLELVLHLDRILEGGLKRGDDPVFMGLLKFEE